MRKTLHPYKIREERDDLKGNCLTGVPGNLVGTDDLSFLVGVRNVPGQWRLDGPP